MGLPITAVYAGLLGILAIVLGAGSGFIRSKTGVSIGDGGHPTQLVAVRRHGNFTEWVPLALILIAILELNGVSSKVIHGMGAALVFARISHPLGLRLDDKGGVARTIGAATTALIVLIASIWAIKTGLS